MICPVNHKTLKSGAVLKEGSFDQRRVESRKDVLVFTTATLGADVEVIGPVSLKIFAWCPPEMRTMSMTDGMNDHM